MNTPQSSEKSLSEDTRGAILIMGIFMCTCLVSALWYAAGIGDAILFRERAQEAADAVAFSEATLNARGMNLIVMINLIMAAVLAVRVALKAMALILGALGAVFTAIALVTDGATASLADQCFNGMDDCNQANDKIRDELNDALKGLSKAEIGVADATPALATVGAFMVGEKYKPAVPFAIALPADPTNAIKLPVDEGTADKLCKEAGEAVGSLVGFLLQKVGIDPNGEINSKLRDALGGVVSASPTYFCEMGTGAGNLPSVDSLFADAANQQCQGGTAAQKDRFQTAERNWETKCAQDNVQCVGVDGQGEPLANAQQIGQTADQSQIDALRKARDQAAEQYQAFQSKFGDKNTDNDDCRSWAKDQMKQQMQQAQAKNGPQQSQQGDGEGMTPKKVISTWQNGYTVAQMLGGATGDSSKAPRAKGLIRLGAMGDKRAPEETGAPLGASLPSVAQAEYFYDCAGSWAGKDCNADDDAMWNFHWRARLRRFSGKGSLSVIEDALEGIGAAKVVVGDFSGTLSSLESNPEDTARELQLRTQLIEAMTDGDNKTRGVH